MSFLVISLPKLSRHYVTQILSIPEVLVHVFTKCFFKSNALMLNAWCYPLKSNEWVGKGLAVAKRSGLLANHWAKMMMAIIFQIYLVRAKMPSPVLC